MGFTEKNPFTCRSYTVFYIFNTSNTVSTRYTMDCYIANPLFFILCELRLPPSLEVAEPDELWDFSKRIGLLHLFSL